MLYIKFTTYFRGGMSSAQANALPTTLSSLKWVKILIKIFFYLKSIKKKEIFFLTKLSIKN